VKNLLFAVVHAIIPRGKRVQCVCVRQRQRAVAELWAGSIVFFSSSIVPFSRVHHEIIIITTKRARVRVAPLKSVILVTLLWAGCSATMCAWHSGGRVRARERLRRDRRKNK